MYSIYFLFNEKYSYLTFEEKRKAREQTEDSVLSKYALDYCNVLDSKRPEGSVPRIRHCVLRGQEFNFNISV